MSIEIARMEMFNLKWSGFSSNVHKSFQNLRKEEDFFDITIVGDDFKHVTAHKLVLSASSEYFKEVFSNSKKYFQSHALICLEGLNQSDLNNILDFIYHGEIQIYQHDLDRFLGIAERLKLEGLIGGEQQPGENDKTIDSLDKNIKTPQNNFLVSRNKNKLIKDVVKKENPVITVQSSDIQSLEELDQKVEESYTKVAPGCFVCNHCDKSFKASSHIKDHVEMHFEGLSFPCTICDTSLRSRASLRMHNNTMHNRRNKNNTQNHTKSFF